MNCYRERAHLLALLTTHYPSVLFMPTDAEEGFSRALMLDIEGVPCTWHIADSDRDLFAHLVDGQVVWDGQSTEEKYDHIRRIIASTSLPVLRDTRVRGGGPG